MECSTLTVIFHIFMDNCLTSFRLLNHLGVNNTRATGVLNKIGDANALALKTNSCKKKKERDHTEQRSGHLGKSSVTSKIG